MVLAGVTSSLQGFQAPRSQAQGSTTADTAAVQSHETFVLGGASDFCQNIYQGKNLAALLKDARFCAQAQAQVQSLPSVTLAGEAAFNAVSPFQASEEFQVEGADAP